MIVPTARQLDKISLYKSKRAKWIGSASKGSFRRSTGEDAGFKVKYLWNDTPVPASAPALLLKLNSQMTA